MSAATLGGPRRYVRRRLAVLLAVGATALVTAVFLSPASGADARARGDRGGTGAELEARSRSAVLELYALETRLHRARENASLLHARSRALRKEQASVRRRLAVAERTLAYAEAALAQRLRLLYEHGEAHPLEILLGAASLEEALTDLDGLRRAAEQDDAILRLTRAERGKLETLSRRVRTQRAEVVRLERAADEQASALERAHAARVVFLERLAERRRLEAAQVVAVAREAEAATARAVASPVGPAAGDPPGPQTLTVWATGYALRGRTASGLPTGWGVVAVDPALIPLGTRMTIPGYGVAVAADIGGSVQGARIDVWFPTPAQALAWGGRTVTVMLH